MPPVWKPGTGRTECASSDVPRAYENVPVLAGVSRRCVCYARGGGQEPKPARIYSVAQAYEVYSAVLPEEWTWRYAKSNTLLIKAETVSYQMCLAPDSKSKKLLEAAIADFRQVNQSPWRLDSRFDISKQYELVAPEILSAPFQLAGQDGWPQFHAEHPNSVGWIELSAVGFNEDKTIAVVYVGHHCGGLCGGGGFSVLHKVDGKWRPLSWSGGTCAWAS